MIKKEAKINVKGREYQVTYPNVGQFYRIEAAKQGLSKGFYNSMIMSPTGSSQHALDMIDIEATLSVLCPDLMKDLKVSNFNELDVRDYKEIRDAYYETVAPLFKEINDMLSASNEDVKEG